MWRARRDGVRITERELLRTLRVRSDLGFGHSSFSHESLRFHGILCPLPGELIPDFIRLFKVLEMC